MLEEAAIKREMKGLAPVRNRTHDQISIQLYEACDEVGLHAYLPPKGYCSAFRQAYYGLHGVMCIVVVSRVCRE